MRLPLTCCFSATARVVKFMSRLRPWRGRTRACADASVLELAAGRATAARLSEGMRLVEREMEFEELQ